MAQGGERGVSVPRGRPLRGGTEWMRRGQKRHRTHFNPPTRCPLMLAAPARDWHVFQQILVEHWDGITRVSPRSDQRSYDGLVAKRRGGGNPRQGALSHPAVCKVGGFPHLHQA